MTGLSVNIVGEFGLSILQSIGWHSEAVIIHSNRTKKPDWDFAEINLQDIIEQLNSIS